MSENYKTIKYLCPKCGELCDRMKEQLHGTASIIHGSSTEEMPDISQMISESSICVECDEQLSGSPDDYKVEVIEIAGIKYMPVERMTDILNK